MAENNTDLDPATRLKRLRMRAWRRGMKEMDIILGGFVDQNGATFDADTFDTLETLMNRQDQQLFAWVSGATDAPVDATGPEKSLIDRIARSYERL